MKKTITCLLELDVMKILGIDENGSIQTTSISNFWSEVVHPEVDDNEYEAICEAVHTRKDEYAPIYISDITGCEWLFHKIVRKRWQEVVKKYKTCFSPYDTISSLYHSLEINSSLYKITLTDDRIVIPTVQVLLPNDVRNDMRHDIPEKTMFKELSDGTLELVKAGLDYDKIRKKKSDIIERVTKVGNRAFEGMDIRYIHLPNCKEVGEYAFRQCYKMQMTKFPKAEILHTGAFMDCHFLLAIYLSKHLNAIKDDVFCGCIHFNSILDTNNKEGQLPEHTKVGNNALAYTPLDHLSVNPIYNDTDEDDECNNL